MSFYRYLCKLSREHFDHGGGANRMRYPNTEDRPTTVLIAAGNILRELTPSTIGMMFFILDNTNPKQNQSEIANAVGRTQSTVSDYQKDLEETTPPLAARRGQRYIITDTGEKVIDLITSMTSQLGLDLSSVDWTDKPEKETVGSLLTPLHDSRSSVPLFILDSLSERGITDSSNTTPIWIDDIFHDIKVRLEESDSEKAENISMNQIRRTIRLRFVDANAARFEEDQATLIDKGVLHAQLLNELVIFLKGKEEIENIGSEETGESATSATVGEQPDNVSVTHALNNISDRNAVTGDIDTQTTQQRFRSSGQPSNHAVDQTPPNVVPVYRFRSVDRAHSDDESDLVLPATMTIEDLIVRARQLANEHDLNTKLDLNWMIQTDSGLYPMTSPDTSPQTLDEVIPSNNRRE